MLNLKNLVAFSVAINALSMTSNALSIKRQTPATCTTSTINSLAVRPKGSIYSDPVTWVGIVQGTTHEGIDGQQASILVTKDDDGNPLKPQNWEFAHCTSLDGHPLPAGYTHNNNSIEHEFFGILRPAGATQHCLALESTDDSNPNDRNSVLDSRCTDIPESYRTWFNYGLSATESVGYLLFADEPMTIVISNTAHAELQFFSNTTKPGSPELELVLISSQDGQPPEDITAVMASQAD